MKIHYLELGRGMSDLGLGVAWLTVLEEGRERTGSLPESSSSVVATGSLVGGGAGVAYRSQRNGDGWRRGSCLRQMAIALRYQNGRRGRAQTAYPKLAHKLWLWDPCLEGLQLMGSLKLVYNLI